MASRQASGGSKVTDKTLARPRTNALAAFWSAHGRMLAVLWACSLIPYLNSFGGGLPLDNNLAVNADPRIRAATWDNIRTIFTSDYWFTNLGPDLYRPVTTLTYLFNYSVFGNGANPAGYHVFNWLLQAVNVMLVYLLGMAIFEEATLAAFTAVLWAAHPLLTESVTNIVGRADELAGFGVLAGLLLYVRVRDGKSASRGWMLAGLAAAVGVGMFSKENAIAVIAVIALWDLAFPAVVSWKARAQAYAAVAAPIALYFLARWQALSAVNTGSTSPVDNPLIGSAFWVARLTAVKVIGKYLWLFAWPAHLSADYSYNQIPVVADWQGLLALAFCLGAVAAAALCLRWREKRPCAALFFLIGFSFVTLAPVANVFLLIGTIMAERFMYLPAIALAALLAMAIREAARRFAPDRSRAAAVVVGVIALAFAARTLERNEDWLSERALWTASVVAVPNSFKPHMSLARDALDSKNPSLDRAAAEADSAVGIVSSLPDDRNNARPYSTAGEADRRKGDSLPDGPARAKWYQKALAVLLRGKEIDAIDKRNIIRVSAQHGRTVTVAGWGPVYLELGRAYLRLGEPAKAIEELQYGRAIRPGWAFSDEMARAYVQLSDPRRAELTLMEGLIADPSASVLSSRLAGLYGQFEAQSCALRRAGDGSSVDFACPMVHDQFCTAARNISALHANAGSREEAAVTVRTAEEMGCPASLFQ
jgi:hypothetical protein